MKVKQLKGVEENTVKQEKDKREQGKKMEEDKEKDQCSYNLLSILKEDHDLDNERDISHCIDAYIDHTTCSISVIEQIAICLYDPTITFELLADLHKSDAEEWQSFHMTVLQLSQIPTNTYFREAAKVLEESAPESIKHIFQKCTRGSIYLIRHPNTDHAIEKMKTMCPT